MLNNKKDFHRDEGKYVAYTFRDILHRLLIIIALINAVLVMPDMVSKIIVITLTAIIWAIFL